jgi:hypothetical protein
MDLGRGEWERVVKSEYDIVKIAEQGHVLHEI